MKTFLALAVCVTMLLSIAGCGQPTAPKPAAKSIPATPAKGEEAKHAAHGAGPHGGTIADWGGGAFHVEFTVDHDKKEAIVYVLGGDEKSPAPIKAQKIHVAINDPETEFDLSAQPLEGEAEGTSSRFVGTHDTMGIVREFAGTLSGEIEATPYTGDFQEVAEVPSVSK